LSAKAPRYLKGIQNNTIFGITMLVASCHNNLAPNYQYSPNMYESIGMKPIQSPKAFKMVRKVSQAVGTIKGFEPYEYEQRKVYD
jgi:hypothetical protein